MKEIKVPSTLSLLGKQLGPRRGKPPERINAAQSYGEETNSLFSDSLADRLPSRNTRDESGWLDFSDPVLKTLDPDREGYVFHSREAEGWIPANFNFAGDSLVRRFVNENENPQTLRYNTRIDEQPGLYTLQVFIPGLRPGWVDLYNAPSRQGVSSALTRLNDYMSEFGVTQDSSVRPPNVAAASPEMILDNIYGVHSNLPRSRRNLD